MACKTLRIGVFFDGTDNSKKSKETYSNVAKLHELYKHGDNYDEKKDDKIITKFRSIYIVGLGHGDGEDTMSLTAGKYGAKKVYDAISQVEEILNEFEYIKGDKDSYQKRYIDVFGFSRGAAEARDFVNTFTKFSINTDIDYKDVRFNFIGIFDTVGSFGIAGNDIDMKPKKEYLDEVDEADGEFKTWYDYDFIGDHEDNDKFEPYNFNLHISSARRIVHLTANDEVRHNFPLTNIHGAGQEVSCIGVHSDVGGGYELKDKETLLIGDIDKLSKNKINKFKKYGWKYVEKNVDEDTNRTIKDAYLYKRRTVPNTLSNAYLHLMYEYAKKSNVPFLDMDEKDFGFVGHFTNEIVKNKKTPLSYKHKNYFRSKYAHQSATQPMKYIYYPLRDDESFAEVIGANTVNVINNQVKRDIYIITIHQKLY